MDAYAILLDIVNGFSFKQGDYAGAERQLANFAENYAILSTDQAELLRSNFDAKDRLGWLRIASTLFVKDFDNADSFQKEKLCKMFFALYSFENLEFGFDGVMDVDKVSIQIRSCSGMAVKIWEQYRMLTTNISARDNLENKIFSL